MLPNPRIAITAGEPAGIGPDVLIQLAQQPCPARLIAIADPELLLERAQQLRLPLVCVSDKRGDTQLHQPGILPVVPFKLANPVTAGVLQAENAPYVLATLEHAATTTLAGEYDALVTGPVNKSILQHCDADFCGHTEYFAKLSQVEAVVMMLVHDRLRIALATTHLPLRAVADAITIPRLKTVIDILLTQLPALFQCDNPRIGVCGLNPHAGDNGALGQEELTVLGPLLDDYRAAGKPLHGPLSADTAMHIYEQDKLDVLLAMYHDQGLPLIKYASFGRAVNVTLGLPFIRTSVDHGTALGLAGTGQANPGSLGAAVALAISLAKRRHHAIC